VVSAVKKPETINYHRTFKPDVDGFVCIKEVQRSGNYECLCGKYTGRLKAPRCDLRSVVEVTQTGSP
jgi:DNA-directed RNA polymerase subunit beta'